MLVFNEGVPGAGKSYDAVKEHILPALKKRRKVFARVNGLNHEAIAEHLQMPLEDVRDLLVCVEEDQVLNLPKVAENDALIVIDEAHKFYVASREPMDRAQEDFFAEHRHDGQDIVLMSQWYRRLHSAVRARVERKAVFQKLTAVGAKNSYRVTYYQSTAPDRFEQTSAETKKYDKAIFPLYQGIRPETTNAEVYSAGGKTVWARIGGYAIWVVPLVLVALWVFTKFFSGDSGLVKHDTQHQAQAAKVSAVPPGVPVPSVPAGKDTGHKVIDTKGMPDEVAYVFETSANARPRLAALVSVENGPSWGVIEWQQDQGGVIERLSLAQLRDMGVMVEVHQYGVKLRYHDHSLVVTSWPVPVPASDGAQTAQQGDQYRTMATPGDGAGSWKENAMARAYVPPEQMKGPAQSDWKPSH